MLESNPYLIFSVWVRSVTGTVTAMEVVIIMIFCVLSVFALQREKEEWKSGINVFSCQDDMTEGQIGYQDTYRTQLAPKHAKLAVSTITAEIPTCKQIDANKQFQDLNKYYNEYGNVNSYLNLVLFVLLEFVNVPLHQVHTFLCRAQICHAHHGNGWCRQGRAQQVLPLWVCKCCRQKQPVSSHIPVTQQNRYYMQSHAQGHRYNCSVR